MTNKKYTYEQVYEASLEYFKGDELAAKVFADKYALQDREGKYDELIPTDMHHRLAKEFARIEAKYIHPMDENEIFSLLDQYKYVVPQGSPMSAIGNPYQVQSLSNCFVVESPYDSYGGICKTDQELAQISKRRGGVGVSISTIRPKGLATANAAKTTDGIAGYLTRFSNTIREVGQCVAEGQKVLTKRGLVSIENVKANKDYAWTKVGWVKVVDVVCNGYKNIVETTSSNGLKIKTSPEHVFLALDNNDNLVEKPIKDFNIGDSIITILGTLESSNIENIKLEKSFYKKKSDNNQTLNTNVRMPYSLNKDLAYYLGYSYGDGSVEYDKFNEPKVLSLACANNQPTIVTKLVSISINEFGYTPSVRPVDGALKKVNINSKIILSWLAKNNLLKGLGHEMVFPQKIIESPISVQMAFLSGYFDADGYASGKKKGYVFSSVNRLFLEMVQKILASVGINSKFHIEDRAEKGWRTLHTLCVVGTDSQSKLVNLMHESVKVLNSKHISKRDNNLTPFKARHFGLVRNHQKNYIPYNAYMSTNCFSKLIKGGFVSPQGMLVQETVASIAKIDKHNTYDLVLEKEHLFWCEGYYIHNSGRRGALMITCSVHHPEVRTFINIKKDLKKVTGANISLQLSDEFMNAVKNNTDYELRWPVDSKTPKISKQVNAREIWNEIIIAAHSYAEPGILFWDTALSRTPADIYTDVGFGSICCNPCAELILSKLDSCRLLLLNLNSYVKNAFQTNAEFDFHLFDQHAQKAQRLMDDMIDLELESIDRIIAKIELDPEPQHVKQIELDLWKDIRNACESGRRTGTGITGLGDCLAGLNICYGSDDSIKMTEEIYKQLAISCYRSSSILAGERGAFPVFSHKKEKGHVFLEQIWKAAPDVYELYKKHGRRNIALTTTAPTGSVSTQTQTTSGIEPAYLLSYVRRKKINSSDKNARIDFTDDMGDSWQEFTVFHPGVKRWMDATGKLDIKESPYWGSTSNEIDWVASVKLQGRAQAWTCHAISKTCNLPNDVSVDTVKDVYMMAWEVGCKGFTVYRDGCRTGVLVSEAEHKKQNRDPNARPEIIETVMAPKRPEELTCDIKKAKIQGESWTIFVGLHQGKPYELFGGLSKYIDIPNKHKIGKIVKNGKIEGITSYNLVVGEDDDKMVIKNIANVFDNAIYGAFTRTISLALRHGCPPQFVVEQLQKDKHSDMTSFSRVMGRVLKQYIIDGTKSAADKTCTACGKENSIIYEEGCLKCINCIYTKCN